MSTNSSPEPAGAPRACDFAGVLVRLRAAAGFETAHAFYNGRLCRRRLGMSFAAYLNLEQGRSLPKRDKLKNLLAVLGLAAGSAPARELIRAYLVQAMGGPELLEALEIPDDFPPDLPTRLALELARKSRQRIANQLTLEQWRALAGEPAAYACYLWLGNTGGWTKLGELARRTGAAPRALRRALKALAAAGLVEVARDAARSTVAEAMIEEMPPLPELAPLKTRKEAYLAGLKETRGRLVHRRSTAVRMDARALERYRQHLAEIVDLSGVYYEDERAEDNAIFLVEGRLTRLFP